MSTRPSNRLFSPGWILVALGLVLFLLQFIEGTRDDVVLLIIGAAFLFTYFANRTFGYLVPGCILLGLAMGGVFAQNGSFDKSFGLGLGFVAIFLIDFVYRGNRIWWPLIPGLALILTASSRGHEGAARVVAIGWPLLFVLAGLWMLRRRGQRRETTDTPQSPEDSDHARG